MTKDPTGGAAATEYELLLKISMNMRAFSSNWAYCDRISSYIAKMVSHNRTDSLLYANLFSSALNELLETAHRAHGESGEFTCAVLRLGDKDRIELTIPCTEADPKFYRDAVERLKSSDLAERYHAALFTDGPLDPSIGLMELAVDYNARLSVEETAGQAVRLTAEFSIEDQVH